jgi:large repetitive protein
MMKHKNKISLALCVLLFLQILLPSISALASNVQAPTNLKVYELNPGYVKLEWEAVSKTKYYRIYQLVGEEKKLLTQTSNSEMSLSVGEGKLTYAVSSFDGTQESPLSNVATIEIIFPEMQKPGNLQSLIDGVYNATLSWDAVSYSQKYNIYKVNNGERTLVTSTKDKSVRFSALSEGKHIFEVTSYNSKFGESEDASQIEVNIVYPDMQAPKELKYQISNGNDVTLSWQRTANANSYKIYRINEETKSLVATTSSLSFTMDNLTEDTHVYEVRSYNNTFKESKDASRIEFEILYPKMESPNNLIFSVYNGNDANLKWEKVEYATSYKVYEIINGELSLLTETTNTQVNLKGLLEGTYNFVVSAYSNRFGESEGSLLEYNVVYPVMKNPEGLVGNLINVNNLYLKWEPVEFATSYNVYRIIDGKREFVSSLNNTFTGIQNLPEGKYVYEVTSNSDRFGESPIGSRVEKEIIFPEMKAPQNLQAFPNQTTNSIALSWEKAEHATEYKVYRIIEGQRSLVKTVPGTVVAFNELPDGEYIYEVTSFSKYGESASSNQVKAFIEPDLEAPAAPVASIEGDDIKLSWEPVQGADSYNVYEIVDGERVLVGNTTDTALTLENLEPGSHEYEIVPVTESGVEGKESTTIKVTAEDFDTTPPVTESNVTDEWLKENFSVQLTATDDKSGVDKTYYSINGTEFAEGTEFAVADEGIHEVSFYSIDKAGNKEEAKTVEVKIDKNAPETASNVTDEWLNQAFTVELTATDDLSGVANTFYSVNDGEYAEGTSFELTEAGVRKVSFYSIDKAGNVEETKTVEINIDKTAPETASNVTDEWLNQAFTVELTATDDLSGVAKTYYSINDGEYAEGTNFELTEAGVHKISFYSTDKAGNVEEAKTVEVKIDKTAPETASNVTDDWLNQAFTVELTATDDLSGVAKTYYSVNDAEFAEGTSFEVSEPGIHKVSFYSIDKAGNVEEAQTVEVKIDKTAPETASNVTDGWLNQAFTVELTATDDLSGVAKTYYSVNDAEFVEGSSFEVSEPGINKVSFYSVDNAGNVEETEAVEVKIDKTAPETASNVTDGWMTQDFTVELTAADDLSGVAKSYYSVNGGVYAEGTSFVVSEEGIHEVSFYSVDQAGNIEEAKAVEVKIDKTAPIVTWNIQKSAAGTDLTTSSCGRLDHWLTPFLHDNLGKKIGSKYIGSPWYLALSNQNPETTDLEVGDELELGTVLTIGYEAADNHSGIAIEELTVNGEKVAKGDQVTFDKTGEYNIQVTVKDNAGLQTTLEKTFMVYIPGNLKITPGTIKMNKGVFTARVTLPKGVEPNFDLSSVTLNGEAAVVDKGKGSAQQASKGMFKFNREDFDWNKGEVLVEFRGTVNGQLVVARTTVTVK